MAEPLIYHRIDYQLAEPAETLRDSLGGRPYLPKGMEVPSCSCGKRMDLYLQFDIREEFGLPFRPGSHLAVFMCEACNRMPDGLSSWSYVDEATAKVQDQLRADYWDFNGSERGGEWTRFYRLMLLKPEGEFAFADPSEFIRPASLSFTRVEEIGTEGEDVGEVDDDDLEDEESDGFEAEAPVEAEAGLPGTSTNPWALRHASRDFKVGGQPAWGGDTEPPQKLLCSCGAPMGFLCYIPERMVFPNGRTSRYTYEHVGSLFTGLCVYILACRAQCHPFAAYPVTQP